MTIWPRVARAGVVVLTADGAIDRVVTLQYNPDSVTRSVQARGATGEGGPGDDALRLIAPPTQTIRFDAELDAADQLEKPAENPAEVESGLHPYVAALELLLHPSVDAVVERDRLAATGVIEVLPPPPSLVVLVWSRHRVVPVRLTELSISEEAFDVRLNPVRVKLSLTLSVLTSFELGLRSRGGALAHAHHAGLAALAARRGFGTITDLGEGIVV